MSVGHWIIVLAVGLLLFGGRGKVSELMGDFAKGIKSFKKGLAEEPETDSEKAEMKTIDHNNSPVGSAGSGAATGTEASRKAG
jgi:sec-independent protein translocase protein TatA